MSDDELELDTLGDRKTALFLIMSDTDTTFNFRELAGQGYDLHADRGALPWAVRKL